VRENGGQYTHGALWTVQALALIGEHERAHALLTRLNPVHHARDAVTVARYAIEPYVIAADVYSAPGLVGRGGWSWYTGAAGWMYRIALEHLLGFTVRGGQVQVAAARPEAFARYQLTYRHDGTTFEIEVDRGDERDAGAWLDGKSVALDAIRLPADGKAHTLKVSTPPPGARQVRATRAGRR
jgi:cellobiose phosphorylase